MGHCIPSIEIVLNRNPFLASLLDWLCTKSFIPPSLRAVADGAEIHALMRFINPRCFLWIASRHASRAVAMTRVGGSSRTKRRIRHDADGVACAAFQSSSLPVFQSSSLPVFQSSSLPVFQSSSLPVSASLRGAPRRGSPCFLIHASNIKNHRQFPAGG